MGLGKTLQMLANIMDEYSIPPISKKKKPNLIVTPPHLRTQWFNEIARHCNTKNKPAVLFYDAKPTTNDPVAMLASYDIILATYEQVVGSYPTGPNAKIPTELSEDQKEVWWSRYFESHRWCLHQFHFHRIVLDEAHMIKSVHSQRYIACRALRGTHRWLMTGSPTVDSIEEFYPYFKFLGVPFTGDRKVFRKNYCGPEDPLHPQRLNRVLQVYLFRRTHEDQLFGAPIQKLPLAKEREFLSS
ncbi:hypothetical protein EJ08DRAFT_589923 [Tothia fuscella]|uniref:Helicase ATP-binding domain-containing protein n=1 Tax=Tothia fuscella TaxID=1048955 RepID=A0A9P4NQ27_9PEZI|nr:hypothetical protein EJ08DRAFT_589923 [Tothia fuscella]